jgi:putative ATP-binding cassette transporter
MRLFSFLLRRSKFALSLSILAGIMSGVISTAVLAVIHKSLTYHQGYPLIIILGYIVLIAILPITRIVSQVMMTRLGQNIIFDFRVTLCRQIISHPLRRLEEIGAPKLLATLTDDVLMVSNAFITIPFICLNLAVVIGCLVYMVWLSWGMALLTIGYLVIGIAGYQFAVRKAIKLTRSVREKQDVLFSYFRAVTEGVKGLKLHRPRRDAFMKEILEPTATSFAHENVQATAIYAAASSMVGALYTLMLGLILYGGPDWADLSRQTLTGYMIVLLYMTAPLDTFMSLYPSLNRANVALDKIESLGLSLKDQAERSSTLPIAADFNLSWNKLEMVGVTHTYRTERDNNAFTLGPISLTLRPAEIVMIAGGNGSGKTTLAKLLAGLYTPEKGAIYLDDQLIIDENREEYRQYFSFLFSDFYLFQSLIGLKQQELNVRARDYLSKLQLDHKVEIIDGKFSTIDLSQGQRKRLALLVSYLEDRPICIFDEWAADQDPGFKEIFYYQLLPEMRACGKTLIVISHDDKYYGVADRIVRMEEGNIEGALNFVHSPGQSHPKKWPRA